MDRYQDYVIKDGKFIGKFEEMYQKFDDPWHQSEDGYFDDLSRKIVAHFIKQYQITSSVEFGCGLGKTMNFIQKETNIDTLGIDISETAIKKAKEKYPDMSFEVNNIENILDYSQYQSFFFSEITWYLLEDKLLDRVFEKMKNNLSGKYFIHNLVFYKGQQKYGNNYFTNLKEFLEFCPFKLLTKVEINNVDCDSSGTSSIFLI